MKTKHRTPWQWTNESALHKGELRATIIEQATRWKRKNREAQYKRTIAKLTRMLQNTEQCLLATQKMTGFRCFRPSHWENVFVNKEEEEEKKRLKTLKRLIRKLKPNDKP